MYMHVLVDNPKLRQTGLLYIYMYVLLPLVLGGWVYTRQRFFPCSLLSSHMNIAYLSFLILQLDCAGFYNYRACTLTVFLMAQ